MRLVDIQPLIPANVHKPLIPESDGPKLRRNENRCWFPDLGFQSVVSQNMVSQSKNGFPKYGFSIKKWFPKIWFLNQNLVNYMFPNQTSAFSRYPVTDSSKCASATDSSCFREIKECITSYDSSVWFKLIVYKVKYSICCLNICMYFSLILFVCLVINVSFFLSSS